MVESGEDLTLIAKPAQDKVPVQVVFDQFDGDAMLKFSVGSPRLVNGTHSAAANLPLDAIRTYMATDHCLVVRALRCLGLMRIVGFRNYLGHDYELGFAHILA